MGPATVRRRFARLARKLLLKIHAAPFQADYFGRQLTFPGQHDLPVLANDLPLFNSPLRRLAQAVRQHEGNLRLLDIGANIGEGVPLVDPQPSDVFWLVEGSAEFLPFLRQNMAHQGNARVIPHYLGERTSVIAGSEVVIAGNAHLVTGKGGEIVLETLDHLFPATELPRPNLLKIDVEGHEPRIFSGGRALLRRDQPVVFMEWYPALLARAGAGVLEPLPQLRDAGYVRAIVYDNHGFLVGDVSLDNSAYFEQLALYSRLRERFYFDLTVFASAHSGWMQAFCVSESDFYGNWLKRRSPDSQ